MNYPFYFTWGEQASPSLLKVERLEGVNIITPKNRHILDLSSLSYQASFGLGHPLITKHVQAQLKEMSVCAPKFVYKLKQDVSHALLDYLSLGGGKLFYTVSGSESVENALKMAREITGRKAILARGQSYHGASLGALSVTGDWRHDVSFHVGQYTLRIPEPHQDPDLRLTRKIITTYGPEDIAAFCLETITGHNGVIIPPRSWYEGISKLCKEFNILLILDEVICGFCRTGERFGYLHYKLKPDFVCMAKAISGGVIPFGAVWTSQHVWKHFEKKILKCGLTNYAHPLGLAALQGVLEIIEHPTFAPNLERLEILLKSELKAMEELPVVSAIRCTGMLAAIDLKVSIPWKKFISAGIFLGVREKEKQLILAPALVMHEKDLKRGLSILKSVLQEHEKK